MQTIAKARHRFGSRSIAVLLLATLFSAGVTASSASTSVSYDFNTAGQLTTQFNSYVASGVFDQFNNGGIGNSGSIGPTSGASYRGDAVFASKDSYSLGPVGSSYTFTSFLRSIGNGGYSGMGFTALTPSAANASSNVAFRPNDALGISVHGGGFVFHNGTSSPTANWGDTNPRNGITRVKASSIGDLLNSGSDDDWYKFVLKIVRDSSTTFDMRVEVWPATAAGVLLRPNEADAIFELNNQAAPGLIAAPTISSYINFSGHRVYNFDNYSVELAGGSSVISPGAPVVLSSSASTVSGVVTFIGEVTSNGGSSVTERGFVFGTNPNPTVADSKVVVGSGMGYFTGSTSALPTGTYYFRAFATNSTGTSYGSSLTDSFVGIAAPAPAPAPAAAAAPAAAPAPAAVTSTPEALASTGTSALDQLWLMVTLILLGAAFVRLSLGTSGKRIARRPSEQRPRL
jgi:hypothetical protein